MFRPTASVWSSAVPEIDLYLRFVFARRNEHESHCKSTTRKATAITLAAALVVAVYLNWQYSRTGVSLNEDAVNVSAAVVETEAEAVAASPITDGLMTEAEAVSSANKNYGEAQLVSVANDSGSKFLKKPASSGKSPRCRTGYHPENAQKLQPLRRGKEILRSATDRKPGRPQCGK